MKQQKFPATNMGSVSLLMTFIVLCLAIFSTLSLSGAVSEYRYSQKLAEHNTNYYEASNTALLTLREIDDILARAYAGDPGSYRTDDKARFSLPESVRTEYDGEKLLLSYEVPVNSTRMLRVVLAVNPPEQISEGYYRILSWQEVSSREWVSDESLQLIKP